MGAVTKKQTLIERQLTESDCAVWVIKAVCFQLNVAVPPANLIRRHIDIKNGGTTIRSVRDALDSFGIIARPVKGAAEAIEQAPLPAIAMLRLDDSVLHYVVLLEASPNRIRYLDPALGGSARSMSREEFGLLFTGYIVLCEKKPGYINLDLGKEPNATRFITAAWLNQANPIVALAIGEVFQLAMLLIGILMLRSFLSSSIFGVPNFWFLGGMALCGGIYLWIAALHRKIQSDIQSGLLFSLFGFATRLIGESEHERSGGFRQTATRCVKAVSAVSNSLGDSSLLPGNTISLLLYIALLFWVDVYAATYALTIALLLPVVALLKANRKRTAQLEVSRTRESNEVALVYLLGKATEDEKLVEDLPWHQLAYCDAVGTQRDCVTGEGIIFAAVGRLNIFAGLLIGGVQHASCGMGHTIAVFFLLGVFSTVVCRWAKRVSMLPECRFQVRSMLDLFSDYCSTPLQFSKINQNLDSEKLVEASAPTPQRLGSPS